MYCTKCGKQSDENMNFCTECGAPIVPQSQTEPQNSEKLSSPACVAPASDTQTATAQKTVADPISKSQPKPKFANYKAAKASLPRPSAGMRVLTVFLCIFFVIMGLGTCFYAGIYSVFRSERIEQAVREFDPDETMIPGTDLSFREWISQEVSEDGEEIDAFMEMLDELDMEEFYDTTVLPYIEYYVNGGEKPQLDTEAIVELIRKSEIANGNTSDIDYDALKEELDRELAPKVDEMLSALEDENGAGLALRFIRLFISPAILIGMIVVCVVLMGLILLCNYRAILSGICSNGVGLIVTGSMVLINGILSLAATQVLASIKEIAEDEMYPVIISLFVSPFTRTLLICGGATLAAGITACVVCKIIRSRQIRRLLQQTV